jgi:hypothetical protein
MPRSQSFTDVEIWNDTDFTALDWGSQWGYWFITSQPDLDYTGVISLRTRRWAKKADGLTVAKVEGFVSRLAAARFVVVDEDHEELLVRSFMRRDKIYRQPNILRAALKQLSSVSSPILRSALAVEVERIGALDDIPDGSEPVLKALREALAKDYPEPPSEGKDEPFLDVSLEGFPEPFGEGLALPQGKGEGKGNQGVRGSGGKGEPEPGSDADPDFVKFWEIYPLKKSKEAARAKWRAALKKTDAADIIAGAERYRDDPGRKAEYTKHPTTWLNQGCWEDEPTPQASNVVAIRTDPFAEKHAMLARQRAWAEAEDAKEATR